MDSGTTISSHVCIEHLQLNDSYGSEVDVLDLIGECRFSGLSRPTFSDIECPVFPIAVIQDDNQSILILASTERRVYLKPDVEWQVLERGKCTEIRHSDLWNYGSHYTHKHSH